ncbi:MAG: hypothetical protein JF595_10495 [Sphingomonadales bacterium]|nr:hypothetical protein [Sphingomonadales bacterium]
MNDRSVVAEILRTLESCLGELDRMGLKVSAAYLDTAIQHLRIEAMPGKNDDDHS